jgi:hypothetical protein
MSRHDAYREPGSRAIAFSMRSARRLDTVYVRRGGVWVKA